MKLLNKISLYYIINTSILFVVGLFAIYFSVAWVISERVEKQLKVTSKEIQVKLSRGIKTEYPPFIEVVSLASEVNIHPQYKDTTIFLEAKHQSKPFRQYTVYKKIADSNYKIIIRTSLIEEEDLFGAIVIVLISILALLLIFLIVINRMTAKKIFKPFYQDLAKLESFSLQKNKELQLNESNIQEFQDLKNALNILAEKSLKEYRSLKEFSENLSHELQTPVAVIKAKTELLLQKEFSENDTNENLQAIIDNTDRLDKLNRSLILLAKLENAEMFQSQKINVGNKLKSLLDNYLDIAQVKKIELVTNILDDVEIDANESLFEILIGNLISNSIKHNFENGRIFIDLDKCRLQIRNDGKEPKQNPESYFKRFSCDEKSQNSLGLGLAIAKKICDLYQYKIEYAYEKSLHVITVQFKNL